ncbi:MAG: hypothetical protein JNK82_39045, partial [Myxococcaceae bacterium]|nr:hypothetical protein [Myxococcaceae bacterium]
QAADTWSAKDTTKPPPSTWWVTLRGKGGELIEQKTVEAGRSCSGSGEVRGPKLRITFDCEGYESGSCDWPGYTETTDVSVKGGKLELVTKSTASGRPSNCWE